MPKPSPGPMTTDQARAFIAAVPWRQVKDVPVGEGLPDGGVERYGEHRHVRPDPHQYVIRESAPVRDPRVARGRR